MSCYSILSCYLKATGWIIFVSLCFSTSKVGPLITQPVFDSVLWGKPFASCNNVGPYSGMITFGNTFTFTHWIDLVAMVALCSARSHRHNSAAALGNTRLLTFNVMNVEPSTTAQLLPWEVRQLLPFSDFIHYACYCNQFVTGGVPRSQRSKIEPPFIVA